jgi:succinylarginine dihydrolase
MDTVGMGDCVADLSAISDRQILEIIDQAFDNRSVIKRRLDEKMPGVIATVLNLYHEIRTELQHE